MTRSQNGWTASQKRSSIGITTIAVDGVEFVGGVRSGDVKTVLGYVAQQVHDRVEKAVNPGCWGYSYRANKNDPNALSNHSSGTAIDFNAPKHPNGTPTRNSFSAAQVAEVHRILDEVDHLVRWGGDYQHTVDSMHFEINGDEAAIAALAKKLRNGGGGGGGGTVDTDLPVVNLARVSAAAEHPGAALPGVKRIQAALNAELGTDLKVDGVFGENTKSAYAAWQRKLGYSGADADGVPGEKSLAELGHGRFRVNA